MGKKIEREKEICRIQVLLSTLEGEKISEVNDVQTIYTISAHAPERPHGSRRRALAPLNLLMMSFNRQA
jgi:hypothetical protein